MTPGATEVRGPRVRTVARRAAAFLRRQPGGPGAAWGRLALAVRAGRGTGTAARSILDTRLGTQRPDGSIAGETNATAMAVLALSKSSRAARWLVRAQSPGGGFGYRPGFTPDVDSTALAAWALDRAGRGRAAHRAAAFVAAAENADGGFPSSPGGESNSQSTGLALVALRLAGPGPRVRSSAGLTPLDYLVSLPRPDGSLEYAAGAHPTPVWTTAQALLGLTDAAGLRR